MKDLKDFLISLCPLVIIFGLAIAFCFFVGCNHNCWNESPEKQKFLEEDSYCVILKVEGRDATVQFEESGYRLIIRISRNGPVPLEGETWWVVYDPTYPTDIIRFMRKVPKKKDI